MAEIKISYAGRVLLISTEVFLISFLGYESGNFMSFEMGKYISLDVLYCLPIIQTAHLTAIHATRRHDTQISTLVGMAVALVWSATEMAIIWPDFPMVVFVLNTFTRSVAFTVIGRVVIKLWREREYAHKDLLTGLATRLELLERLQIEQNRSERTGSPYSVLFIDIDRFKSMNDLFGHQVGDEALVVLANILKESSRRADVSARLGGDEFVLLLPDTDQQSCNIMIKRIEASTRQTFEERLWPISVSIGQATKIGKDNKGAEGLIQSADENMYEEKKRKQQMMQNADALKPS